MSKEAHFPTRLRRFRISLFLITGFAISLILQGNTLCSAQFTGENGGNSNRIALTGTISRDSRGVQNAHNAARMNFIPNSAPLRATHGFQYKTENFIILDAPSAETAREFGEAAEQYRRELAVLWFGKEMPDWSAPCPISCKVGLQYGASGETSFVFNGGEVYGWEMSVQGSRERILDSVLPHEISHMIFASMFRRKVPRWIDEGAATSLEHVSERANYRKMLLDFADPKVRRTIPFNRMVEIQEYPEDFWPVYSQGNAVVEFLIAQGGHRQLTRFIRAGLDSGDWNQALRIHYGYENLGDLQLVWIRWVQENFPSVDSFEPALVRNRKIRGQSPSRLEEDSDSIPPFSALSRGPYRR